MKRILIFSLAYYPKHVSGAEAAVKEVTDRIDSEQIEFHMLTHRFDSSDAKDEKIGNVWVHRIGFGPAYLSKILFIPMAAVQAALLGRKRKFDGYWALMTYMLFPIAILRLFGDRTPYVITLQDGDPYEKVFERWFIRPVTWLLDIGFRNARVVHAISNYLASWPIRRGYTGEIVLVRNGANPNDLKESFDRDRILEIHKRFQKSPGDVWLVNTARLVYQKGNDTTIRALATLPPNVKLLLVGGGDEEVTLKSLANDLGVADRVFFVGQVERSQVTNYRKASDIFVGPSRSEGLGNAFLSAMASRLPVIATREGGLADFLFDPRFDASHPQTGWAVEADKPEQIAEAVKEIMASPEKVSAITNAAREMVIQKYDWDYIAKEMESRVFVNI